MIQRFKRTGERVFAFDGNTFNLGISDTVTITPVAVTLGWRFNGRRAIPYLGGGMGSYHYTETSAGADPSDNLDGRSLSYHVVVGAEWQLPG
jgi:opacity protein-like surface antigen